MPVYEIKVRGCLDRSYWREWYGLSADYDGRGVTTLSGEVIDQAALYGLLARLRDLAAPLVSVNEVEVNEVEVNEVGHGERLEGNDTSRPPGLGEK